jgi:hypothetical protein
MKYLMIRKVSKKTAENFMGKYEHLGNLGLGVWHWGLFGGDDLLSVVSYGTVCFSKNRGWLCEIANLTGSNIIQLCRGGTKTTAPKGTASRLISLANKEILKMRGPTIIVAYADPNVSEIGTIYQASNFIYTGKTDPKGQANYLINGKFISGWKVRKIYGTRCRKKLREIDPNCQVINLPKKYRYVGIVAPPLKKKEIHSLIDKHSKSYPKRESENVCSMIN